MSAPVQAGDALVVEHSCTFTESAPQVHTAPVAVERVVPLNSGMFRVECIRCDGSPVHVVMDRQGRDYSTSEPIEVERQAQR